MLNRSREPEEKEKKNSEEDSEEEAQEEAQEEEEEEVVVEDDDDDNEDEDDGEKEEENVSHQRLTRCNEAYKAYLMKDDGKELKNMQEEEAQEEEEVSEGRRFIAELVAHPLLEKRCKRINRSFVSKLKVHMGVTCCAFHPSGQYLVTGGYDDTA
jgi:hypothetical protein